MPVCLSHNVGLPEACNIFMSINSGAQVMGSIIRVDCEISWGHHHLCYYRA
jgi:hypothetical protein